MDPRSTSIASESGEKAVVLPKQLEAVTKATSFPLERHRWNTNEEVAAILIAFEHHQKWQSREVKPRPASGSMLLYNRKKVRYRKDGYCWKKRKDGKTTREDHMKLKVQGVECIYGCYVHSAILPTFHRRCYWLLQNPDLVLVHYLNVPLQDENKLSLPSLQHVTEKKEWSRDDLILQLRPMFPGAGDGTNNQGYSSQTEETVQSIVLQLMESQHRTECTCTNTTSTCDSSTCKNKCRVISPKTQASTSTHASTPVTTSALPNRIMNMVQGQKPGLHVSTVTTPAQQRPVMAAGGASLIINSGSQRQLGANTPLILNLSQLQGSNGLIILSSQSNTPISIVNNSLLGNNVSCYNNKPHPSQANHPQSHLINGVPAASGAPPSTVSAPADPHCREGQGHIEARELSQGQQLHLQSPVLQRAPPQLVTEEGHSPLCRPDMKPSNGEVPQAQILHGGLIVKEEILDEDKSNISMEECTSRLQLMNHEPQVEDIQDGRRTMAEDLDNSMEIGHRGEYREPISTENQPAAMDDIVNELNLKNEMQNFSASALVMTADDIHKALTANLPVAGTSLDDPQANTANQSTSSLDSIEAIRSSMVSPHSTDFNFDAFDILDVLPDFDSSDHIITPPVTSTATHSRPASTSAASSCSLTPSHNNNNTGCTSCQNNNQSVMENKSEVRAGIANITDFSPEWAYAEGGVKVLVTGPWYSTTSPYTVLFDSNSVTATLVQSGVLRCFCPAHSPGLVTLQVACEGYVISNSCVFEYKAKPETVKAEGQSQWFGVQEDHLKMALLNKLEQIEKRLSADMGRGTLSNRMEGKMRSHDAFEVRLLDYVDQLSQCMWTAGYDVLPRSSLTLLHLVAALGYTRLTLALIKWRSENPSLILESEVDALSQDDYDNTPLMWACARGCLETAIVLYHWNPAALGITNRDKQSPLATARSYGNPHIAEHIERLEIAQLPKPSIQATAQSSSQKGAKTDSARASSKPQQQLQRGAFATRKSLLGSEGAPPPEAGMSSLDGGQSASRKKRIPLLHDVMGLFSFGDEIEAGMPGLPGLKSPLVRAPLGDQGGALGASSSSLASPLPPRKVVEKKHGNKSKTLVSSGDGQLGSVAWPPPPLRDLTIEIPSPPPMFEALPTGMSRGNASSQSTPSARCTMPLEAGVSRNMRLLKRTSVEVLPGYLDIPGSEVSNNISTKNAKTCAAKLVDAGSGGGRGRSDSISAVSTSRPQRRASNTPSLPSADFLHDIHHKRSSLQDQHSLQGQGHCQPQGQGQGQPQGHGHGLRSVSSDPHLVGLVGMSNSQMLLCDDNPMISVNDRDLNSPVMFMQTDTLLAAQSGLTLEDIQRETVAMETDSPRSDSPYVDVEKFSEEDEDLKQTSMSFLEQLFQSVGAGTEEAQSQIVTLANQIIAAMPERIKLSPAHGEDSCMLVDPPGGGLGGQRERSSSHSSFSSYSPAATPPCDDSGISTPLEGLAFEEYRYPDMGTPASSLSPASSCLQSPYSFTLDSPPPTTAEFTEYFNAPTTFMEKDFSQLTLSDHEQRRLYEAAKIIQNFYRHYKDKKQQAQKQRQREIEAAILIQSYYRRYKQYAYYKKMTQAAVLIQSQFRSYYAQKRFKRSREAATVIQNQYRTYKEHERFKKSRNAAVIIQQRFRSHYQRKRSQEMARQVQKAVKSSHSSESNVTATGVERPRSTDSEQTGALDGSKSLTTVTSSASEHLQSGDHADAEGKLATATGGDIKATKGTHTEDYHEPMSPDGITERTDVSAGSLVREDASYLLGSHCHGNRAKVCGSESEDD